MSQEKVSPIKEHFVKGLNDSLFGILVEIDDHIAAEDDVHFAKKGKPILVEQVKMADRYKFPNLVVDLQAPFLFLKKPLDIALFGGSE